MAGIVRLLLYSMGSPDAIRRQETRRTTRKVSREIQGAWGMLKFLIALELNLLQNYAD